MFWPELFNFHVWITLSFLLFLTLALCLAKYNMSMNVLPNSYVEYILLIFVLVLVDHMGNPILFIWRVVTIPVVKTS